MGLGIPNAHSTDSIREAVEITRKLFTGAAVSYTGKYYTVNNLSLRLSGRSDIPIYISTRGQKFKLAGEVADGTLTHGCAIDYVKQFRKHIAEGSAIAKRDPKDIKSATIVPVFVTDDYEWAVNIIKPMLAAFIGSEYDDAWLHTFNVEKAEAEPFKKSWGGDVDYSKLPDMLSDGLVDRLVQGYAIIGTAEECIDRICKLEEFGLSQLVPMVDLAINKSYDEIKNIILNVASEILPAF